MQKQLPPFSCSYTPNVPELLNNLGCTLAISTYQAGKVIFISARNDEKLVQLPRNFDKAMGICLKDDFMAVAGKDEVVLFRNSKELAQSYPPKPNTYDALYMPRVRYITGPVDIHDLDFGADGLYAVNTLFSCIIKVDEQYSYTPYWQPKFIDQLVPEDRCHLNGMAMENGKLKYVTAFNEGNSKQSWRDVVTTAGILIDVDSNEIIARDLKMPHSPRLIDKELYVLFSATGELVKIDKEKGSYEVLTKIDGFVRGMAKYDEYLFIGLSKLRKNSSTFAKLSIADKANQSGILIIHLPTASKVGQIIYHTSVDEIYDIQVLPDSVRPNIIGTQKPEHKFGIHTPETTFWGRPAEK